MTIMKIDKVYPNPTVKEVNFQLNFPNLFLIESKIGDFQFEIMDEFPDSELLIKRHVVFAQSTKGFDELKQDSDQEPHTKVWQFSSEKGYRINVTTKSIHITSNMHKSYNMGDNKFRDIIEFVVSKFLKVFPIKKIKRIGLRYVDHAPIFKKENKDFKQCYNTTFPLSRFKIENAIEMSFGTIVKRGNYFLRYIEVLPKDKDDLLILDFDGYAQDIKTGKWLETLDNIHLIIRKEFENSIKEPIYKYMEKEVE